MNFKQSIEGVYSPLDYKIIKRRIRKGIARVTPEYGGDSIEQKCNMCADWWPIDTEFWHAAHSKKQPHLIQPCRACIVYRQRTLYKKAI